MNRFREKWNEMISKTPIMKAVIAEIPDLESLLQNVFGCGAMCGIEVADEYYNQLNLERSEANLYAVEELDRFRIEVQK